MRHYDRLCPLIRSRYYHQHTTHSYTHPEKIEITPPLCKGCSGVTKTVSGSPRAHAQQLSKPSKTIQDNPRPSKMTSKTLSKADLSHNWREPLPAAAAKKIAEKMAKPPTRILPPTNFRSRAWVKKPEPVTNPYPQGPWCDFTEYKPGLKCELCKTTIRKSVFPQETQCGHIFCAACIHTHYYLENKKKCPNCAKYIEEEDDPSYCRTCWSAPCECHYDRDDDGCPGCGLNYCYGHCDEPDECPCGYGACGGDCGTLSCGCIDVCRGRCDSEYGYFGGW